MSEIHSNPETMHGTELMEKVSENMGAAHDALIVPETKIENMLEVMHTLVDHALEEKPDIKGEAGRDLKILENKYRGAVNTSHTVQENYKPGLSDASEPFLIHASGMQDFVSETRGWMDKYASQASSWPEDSDISFEEAASRYSGINELSTDIAALVSAAEEIEKYDAPLRQRLDATACLEPATKAENAPCPDVVQTQHNPTLTK